MCALSCMLEIEIEIEIKISCSPVSTPCLLQCIVLLQIEQAEANKAAKKPDISPLIALEQSSVDVSAADLAGAPAGPLQDAPLAATASSDSASPREGVAA